MKLESRTRATLSILFSVTLVAGLWPLPNAGATSQVQDASDPAAAVVEVREADASAVEASDPVEDASTAGASSEPVDADVPAVSEENGTAAPAPDASAPAASATDATPVATAPAVEAAASDVAASAPAVTGQAASVSFPALSAQERTVAGVTVTADAAEGTFPEGTVLVVRDADSLGFATVAAESLEAPVRGAIAVDVSFRKDGVEVEPAVGQRVSVRLSLEQPVAATIPPSEDEGVETLPPQSYVVMHLSDSGKAEPVDTVSATATGATFSATSFSVYGIGSIDSDEGLDVAADDLAPQSTAVVPGGSAELSRTMVREASFDEGGTENTISLLDSGLFRMTLAGGKGGNVIRSGGAGGTTTVVTPIYNDSASTLYAVLGGAGRDQNGTEATEGGANGGGGGGRGSTRFSGIAGGASGGGATHIATIPGELYDIRESVNGSVLAVAGGGGGAGGTNSAYAGGAGGGATGGNGQHHVDYGKGGVPGGTQTSGYAIGLGKTGAQGTASNKTNSMQGRGGGGGGYWGGSAHDYVNRNNGNAAGGGGSGFLNASFVDGAKAADGGSSTNDFVTTNSQEVTTTVATTTQGGNSGAGTASIEYIASVVKLDKQNATVQGTKAIYPEPVDDIYHLTYSTEGLGPEETSITPPSRPGWTYKGYWTEAGYDIWSENGHSGHEYVDDHANIMNEEGQPLLYTRGTHTLFAHMDPNWYTVSLNPGTTSERGTEQVFERFETGIYADKELVANKPQVYSIIIPKREATVGYDANGGTALRTREDVYQTFEGYFDGDEMLIDGNGAITGNFANDRFMEDVTLTGKWSGGTCTLPGATRTGYRLVGWYEGDEFVGAAGDAYTPTKLAVQLKAEWEPLVFNIGLDNDAATTAGSSSVFVKYENGKYQDSACETPMSRITVPQRTYNVTFDPTDQGTLPEGQQNPRPVSYSFDGYFTPTGGTSKLIGGDGSFETLFSNTFFLGDTTLHAHWTQQSTPLPTPTPTSEELHFLGWATSADAHSGMAAGTSYTPTADQTLHALWAEIWYTVSYEEVGAAVGFNPPNAIDLGSSTEALNAEFTVENPVRPGYEFEGWDISGMTAEVHWIDGVPTTETSVSKSKATTFKKLQTEDKKNVTFRANWKPITKEVRLDNQGANLETPGSEAVYQAYGQEVYKTMVGTEYRDAMGTGEDGANPIALPAKSFSVTYDLNGKGEDTPAATPAPYTFGGYYTEPEGAGTQLISSTGHRQAAFSNTFFRGDAENPRLFAKWTGGSATLASYTSHAAGFRFLGWDEDREAASPTYLAGDSIPLAADKQLYAVYDQPTYVVAYSANGGVSAPPSQVKGYNVDLELEGVAPGEVPVRANSESDGSTIAFDANNGSTTGVEGDKIVCVIDSVWTFDSWNTHIDGSGTRYDATNHVYAANEAATLHAQWREYATRRAVTLPVPERYGYRCEGWFTAPTGGTRIGNPGETVMQPTSDTKLYAQWSALEYDVEYYDANVKVGTTPDCAYDTPFSLTTSSELHLSHPGWEFSGWTMEEGSLDTQYADGARIENLATPTGKVRMFAVWERTISFVSGVDDGFEPIDAASEVAGGRSLGTQTLETDEVTQYSNNNELGPIQTPDLRGIDGFEQVGWSIDGEDVSGSINLAPGAEVEWTDAETTLYGVYSRTASVSYDGAGATSGSTGPTLGSQVYNSAGVLGKAHVTLAENGFTRKGHTFVSWSLGKEGEKYAWKAPLREQAATTAEAVWLDNKQYLVTFDANGGEGDMAPQVMDLGVKTALSENAFEREGFDFVGWNTAADGSGTAFPDREEVLDLAETGEEITLFAQWKEKPAQGGSEAGGGEAPKGAPRGGRSPLTGDPTSLALVGVLVVVAGAAVALGVRSRRRRRQ